MTTVNCKFCGAMLRDEDSEDFDNEICSECVDVSDKEYGEAESLRPLDFNSTTDTTYVLPDSQRTDEGDDDD
jgi:hypothetical protein